MSTAPATEPSSARRAAIRSPGCLWRVRCAARRRRCWRAPLGWLGVVYLGSLVVLFIASFWSLNEFTGLIDKSFSFDNYQTIVTEPVYRKIVWRTVSIAALVTVTDIVLAFPIAFYMARVASRAREGAARRRRADAAVGELPGEGLLVAHDARRRRRHQLAARPVRAHVPTSGYIRVWIVMSYLWLPYMILPLYAGLERIPTRCWTRPATSARGRGDVPQRDRAAGDAGDRAGSIFTFSLTLGDYITPQLVSNTQFIGNVVYANVGIANNLPLAAAFATVPVVIMVIYLLIVRRLGAFEAL